MDSFPTPRKIRNDREFLCAPFDNSGQALPLDSEVIMQKKLLITVSDDISYFHGVRFVASFFRNKSAVNATIFYVAPRADIAGKSTTLGELGLDMEAGEAAREKGQKAIDAARRMLLDRGFPSDNIVGKFIFRQFGTVKDIVTEAKAGAYDAVVLGRRGYALFESVLPMSVTREIMNRDIDFPIWICRHPEELRRNVLLCIDGSDAGLRMVDHVGFMLSGEDEHSVTLFHVDVGEGESQEAILQEARKRLLEKWASNGRIDSVVAKSQITGVAETILGEAEARGCAVVGVGRAASKSGSWDRERKNSWKPWRKPPYGSATNHLPVGGTTSMLLN
jgi:nucleotide-binding universal stress UspA family protein